MRLISERRDLRAAEQEAEARPKACMRSMQAATSAAEAREISRDQQQRRENRFRDTENRNRAERKETRSPYHRIIVA